MAAAYQLGKKAPRVDDRTLKLAKYVSLNIPLPQTINWIPSSVSDFGMMLNDSLGDCVCAALGHLVQIWTFNATGKMVTVPDKVILKTYETVGHYNPNDQSTDNGCIVLDALQYFRQTGVAGHKISAYAQCAPKNRDHIKAAIALFGAVDIGVEFPQAWMDSDVWDAIPDAAEGGHCVIGCGYTDVGVRVLSWGKPYLLTWEGWDQRCDESYALLSPDWIAKATGTSPSGLDTQALQQDILEVTG